MSINPVALLGQVLTPASWAVLANALERDPAVAMHGQEQRTRRVRDRVAARLVLRASRLLARDEVAAALVCLVASGMSVDDVRAALGLAREREKRERG